MALIVSDTTITSDDLSTVRTVVWDDGKQTVSYIPGLGTPGANTQTLLAKAPAAFTNNATYLAIVSPTTAQAVTQVARLTRQVNALIKLTQGLLADTTGT